MWTYRVDLKELTFTKVEYQRRNNSSIWINDRRRDTKTSRYVYLDDLSDVRTAIEDQIFALEAEEQVALNKKFKQRRDALDDAITKASTSFGRL